MDGTSGEINTNANKNKRDEIGRRGKRKAEKEIRGKARSSGNINKRNQKRIKNYLNRGKRRDDC